MSGGQIIGGVGGAIIGAFVGGPVGAVYGAQIGLTVGGIIDPPEGPDFQGPRLDDLSIQSSTYGAIIPRAYGTVPIIGNIIWLENNKLKEVSEDQDVGGKGGPTSTQTLYSYFATFAVGLCEGPIAGVKRIWLGPDLWYDGSKVDADPSENTFFSILASQANQANFEVYLGTDDQEPDSRIEAEHGVGNVPAYQGLAYIVFKDLPLKEYGNTIPPIKVEVVSNATSSATLIYDYVSNPPGEVSSNNLLDDQGLTNMVSVVVDAGDRVRVSNTYYKGESLSIPTYEREDVAGSAYSDSTSDIPLPGQCQDVVFAYAIRNSGSSIYHRVNFQSYPYDTYAHTSNAITQYGPFVVIGTKFTTNALRLYNFVDGSHLDDYFTSDGVMAFSMLGTKLYHLTTAGMKIYECGFQVIGLEETIPLDTDSMPNPDSHTPAWIEDGIFWAAKCTVDGIFLRGWYMSDWSLYRSVNISESQMGFNPANYELMSLVVKGNIMGVCLGHFADASHPNPTVQFYQLSGVDDSPVDLADIVEAECLKSNLILLSDLDTSLLTDTVKGYRTQGKGAIRANLEPLRGAYLFDVVQSGYGIKFVPRGSSSSLTIPEGDLAARPYGDGMPTQISHETEMDSQLPAVVSVRYLDPTRDYDINEQYSERVTTDTVKTHRIDLPLVLGADESAQLTEKLLNMYWVERDSIDFILPASYRKVEPADVITIEGESATYEIRVTSVDQQTNETIRVVGKFTSAATYVSTAEGGAGNPGEQYVPFIGTAEGLLLDIPVIIDSQNTTGIMGVMKSASDSWGGGLFMLSDGVDYSTFGAVSGLCNFGFSYNVLTEHDGLMMDLDSEFTVYLNESVSSITRSQLLNGKNYLAYGVEGRWEIIRFQDVVDNGDGSFTLSQLKRGDRGTEWTTGLHQSSDVVVFLDDPDNIFVGVESSVLGVSRTYRAVTIGLDIDSASDFTYTYEGENLKPYPPTRPSYLIESDGDFVISWTRRTRVNGEWKSNIEVPLSETAENYEVDVFLLDGTFVRTLSVTAETATYSFSDQITDGSTPAPIALPITNPGAETGDTTGWTNETGSLSVQTTNPAPYQGSYYFMGGANLQTTAYQDIDVSAYSSQIDAGTAMAYLGWWQNSFSGNDDGEMQIFFLDGTDTEISNVKAGITAPTVWTLREIIQAVPVNTRKFRIKMNMERDSGTNNDAYIDSIDPGIILGGIPGAYYNLYQVSSEVGRGNPLTYRPAQSQYQVVKYGDTTIVTSSTTLDVETPSCLTSTHHLIFVVHDSTLTIPYGWELLEEQVQPGQTRQLSILVNYGKPSGSTLTLNQSSAGRFLAVALCVRAPGAEVLIEKHGLDEVSGAHGAPNPLDKSKGLLVSGSSCLLNPSSGEGTYLWSDVQITPESVVDNRLCVGYKRVNETDSTIPTFTDESGPNDLAEISIFFSGDL